MSFQYLFQHAPLLLFAVARIAALIFTAPLLNSRAIPPMAKAGLALMISVVTVPHMVQNGYTFPDSAGLFLILMLGEVAIGLTMALIIQLYFSIFQLAGQLFTTQIGFAASQVFDPMGEVELPLTGQLFNMAGMYLFLSINGFHKLFMSGVYLSFTKIRPSTLFSGGEYLNEFFITAMGRIFTYSLQIAFPIMATLMIMSVTMGLLAKAAPQMNLLMLGFPINITVGFLILILIFPPMINYFVKIIETGFDEVLNFLGAGGEA